MSHSHGSVAGAQIISEDKHLNILEMGAISVFVVCNSYGPSGRNGWQWSFSGAGRKGLKRKKSCSLSSQIILAPGLIITGKQGTGLLELKAVPVLSSSVCSGCCDAAQLKVLLSPLLGCGYNCRFLGINAKASDKPVNVSQAINNDFDFFPGG